MIDMEQARVRQTLAAMIANVDTCAFDIVERLFADRVSIDYTSLWGGEPAIVDVAELLAGWRSTLSRFDATFHEIDDFAIAVNGSTAEAQCSVNARHWQGTDVWQLLGHYAFKLRLQGHWQIEAMQFKLAKEIGPRPMI